MPADTDKIRSIFLTAVEHYSAEQWPAYLDGACAGDLALRRRVEKLLEAQVASHALLDHPYPSC